MKYKKQRGQRRKLKVLCNNINQIHPFENTDYQYEHFHVPCDQFISSPKTSGKIKTEFCRAWLKKTAEIISEKPVNLNFCKVIAMIDERDLWRSQINIFYDADYYNSFWSRDSAEQKWSGNIKKCRSFLKEGYTEILNDDNQKTKNTLWFYGDIN